jgi:hypothetical protein
VIDAERSILADQTLLRPLSCLADLNPIVDLEEVVERDSVVVPEHAPGRLHLHVALVKGDATRSEKHGERHRPAVDSALR